MTGYGFCGPMTAAGTVFASKDDAAAAVTTAHYPGWQAVMLHHSMNLLAAVLGALWRA